MHSTSVVQHKYVAIRQSSVWKHAEPLSECREVRVCGKKKDNSQVLQLLVVNKIKFCYILQANLVFDVSVQ